MKRLAVVAFIVCGFFSHQASANLWQTAPTLPEKKVALGVFPQVLLVGSTFGVTGTVTYGLIPKLQVEGRLGFVANSLSFGGFLKYFLVKHEIVDFSIWGGFQYLGSFAIQAAGVVSHSFDPVDLYLAPQIGFAFSNPALIGFSLIPGVSVAIRPEIKIYVEANIGFINTTHVFSAGVRYFF